MMGRILLSCICIILANLQFSVVESSECPFGHSPPSPPTCDFSIGDIESLASTSSNIEGLYDRYINLLTEAGLTVHGDTPGTSLFYGGDLKQEIRKLKFYGNSIITFLKSSLHKICHDTGITPEDFMYCLKSFNVSADGLEICETYKNVDCSELSLTYQPLDGVCVNNEDEPFKGAVNTPYKRVLKNSYVDSIHETKIEAFESQTPSARLLSNGLRDINEKLVYDTTEHLNNDFQLFFLNFAIYDITKTQKAQTASGNFGFECCECNGKSKITSRFQNRHCMPIEIPPLDKHYHGQTCMNYIRAMVTHDNCDFKEAQILNFVSHFLDLDTIYAKENVKTAIKNGGKFEDTFSKIHRAAVLGDERISMPQIFAMNVIFFKFHNLVLDELTRLYPELPTDVKFFEARRYVVAFYQKTIYQEILSEILSGRTISKYKITAEKSCYKPSYDPTVLAEFTSSAARYMHTFIDDSYQINLKNGTKANFTLRQLGDETMGYTELTGVVTGLLDSPWNFNGISSEISHYLLSRDNQPGLDLRSLDIQGERDFGVGSYCDALYHFNFTKGECIKSFNDFEEFVGSDNVKFLRYAYENPCDVDFGVGSSLHHSTDGDIFSDIIDRTFGIQFKNLKCGDPYFYTNALSPAQIKVLKKYNFKDILCNLLDGDLPDFPQSVFLTKGERNPLEPCKKEFSLEDWELKHSGNTPVEVPSVDSSTTTFKPSHGQ